MIIFYVVLAVALTAMLLWAYFTAQRLNRLHIRTDSARQSLNAALDRRCALVGALIPGATEVARKAEAIPLEYPRFSERSHAERAVSEVINAQPAPIPEALVDAAARVELAHRFYNEAVTDTRGLRTRSSIRFLRLGGAAPLPEYFELVVTDQRG